MCLWISATTIRKHAQKSYVIDHKRPKASTGLWLGTLVGLSAAVTILKKENIYSEICLFVGITGFSLVLCSLCLYVRLSIQQVTAKDSCYLLFTSDCNIYISTCS